MPRSRTFSNLPIPTRHKKHESRIPSFSHTRDSSIVPPPTRLPTPPASTRKHVMGSIPAAASRYQSVRNRMKRSDTMPLLSLSSEQVSNLPRPTAFKENISLSPIKPLPELEPFDECEFSSPLPAGSYMEDQLWEQTPSTVLPRDPSFCGALPTAVSTEPSPPRDKSTFYSTPHYHSRRGFQSHSGSFSRPAPVQRWNSQPVLTDTTNIRAAGHPEVRQTRLLSARQAPTPPLAQTPLSPQVLGAPATRVRGNSVSSSVHHLRRSSTQTLLNLPLTPEHTASQVSAAEPSAYWCGRMSALLDRYRNKDLASSLASTGPKSETDKLHRPAANTARLRRALEHLHSQCVTEEARESFVRFQLQFASLHSLPELSRPFKTNRKPMAVLTARPGNVESRDTDSGEHGKSSEAEGSSAIKSGLRKISILDRMLGRREKRESSA